MMRANRLIVVLYFCFLLLSMAGVPASAAGTTEFAVRTDKDTLRIGDTVTCTVSMGTVEDLYGVKLKITIPEGLTFVEGSGVIDDQLNEVLNAAKTEFVEATGVFLAGACHYSSTSETVLFQFQCTVDADAPDTMEMFLDIDPENVFDSQYQNISFTTTAAVIHLDDTCAHSWTGATADEDNGHWFDCQLCEMSRIEDHMDGDEDGVCDVCGYGTPVKKGTIAVPIVIMVMLILAAASITLLVMKQKRHRS